MWILTKTCFDEFGRILTNLSKQTNACCPKKVVTVEAEMMSEYARCHQNDLCIQTSLKFSCELMRTVTVFSRTLNFLCDLKPFLGAPRSVATISCNSNLSCNYNMDIDTLISLVPENRYLWYIGEKHYHNRDISRQKWEEVATQLNISCKYNNFLFWWEVFIHFISKSY